MDSQMTIGGSDIIHECGKMHISKSDLGPHALNAEIVWFLGLDVDVAAKMGWDL